MSSIFGNTMAMTQKSLDYLWLKQTVSLNNIANNDTPGFKAQYVTFEDQLKKKLLAAESTGRNNIDKLRSGIENSQFTIHNTQDSARLDGNNVQVDAENVEFVRTSLQFQYQIQSINSDINRIKIAIKG